MLLKSLGRAPRRSIQRRKGSFTLSGNAFTRVHSAAWTASLNQQLQKSAAIRDRPEQLLLPNPEEARKPVAAVKPRNSSATTFLIVTSAMLFSAIYSCNQVRNRVGQFD